MIDSRRVRGFLTTCSSRGLPNAVSQDLNGTLTGKSVNHLYKYFKIGIKPPTNDIVTTNLILGCVCVWGIGVKCSCHVEIVNNWTWDPKGGGERKLRFIWACKKMGFWYAEYRLPRDLAGFEPVTICFQDRFKMPWELGGVRVKNHYISLCPSPCWSKSNSS